MKVKRPTILPKGFTTEVISFQTLFGKIHYKEIAGRVFKLDQKFIIGWSKLAQYLSEVNSLVIVKNAKGKGKGIALGGFIQMGDYAFIHSLCVLKKYQGAGLSKVIYQIILNLGTTYNFDKLVFTSINPIIINQANKSKTMYHLHKVK